VNSTELGQILRWQFAEAAGRNFVFPKWPSFCQLCDFQLNIDEIKPKDMKLI
jgi:hypothetical protein